MLHLSGLSTTLWAEATACAVDLQNRVESKTGPGMTPYEAWFKRKPDLSHLKIFGSDAYLHIPRDERAKFDPKAIRCKFVGYCDTQKGFRLWDPEANKVRVGRDVIFNEQVFGPKKQIVVVMIDSTVDLTQSVSESAATTSSPKSNEPITLVNTKSSSEHGHASQIKQQSNDEDTALDQY